jgi:hypothetical protein
MLRIARIGSKKPGDITWMGDRSIVKEGPRQILLRVNLVFLSKGIRLLYGLPKLGLRAGQGVSLLEDRATRFVSRKKKKIAIVGDQNYAVPAEVLSNLIRTRNTDDVVGRCFDF